MAHKIKTTMKSIDDYPDVPEYREMLAGYSRQKVELENLLERAKQENVVGDIGTAKECQSLITMLATAENKTELRERLKAKIRLVVSQVWLHVVKSHCLDKRGRKTKCRVACVQLFFKSGQARWFFIRFNLKTKGLVGCVD